MMRNFLVLVSAIFMAQVCHGGEAERKFQAIATDVLAIVKEAQPEATVTQDGRTLVVQFDTMVYTVHGGSKTGEYSPKTHQETGPKLNGFVIDLSLNPLNPIAAVAGQTWQTTYWQEFFWHGHADDEEYIHFIFKFGKRVDDNLKRKVIQAVTGSAQQPPAN